MMSNEQINFLHQQEEEYEKLIKEKKYQLKDELDSWKLNHYGRLTPEEWNWLERFLGKYEIDEDTELHQVIEAYVEELGKRYDFLIYE